METIVAPQESHNYMSLVLELSCPKCGAEMEPIETTVEQLPLQDVRLCPNCYLVSWNGAGGVQFRQGVPVPNSSRARSEGNKREC